MAGKNPAAGTDRDRDSLINLALWEELARQGRCFVNYARIEKDIALRRVVLNHEVCMEDIDRFFQNLIQAGERLDV